LQGYRQFLAILHDVELDKHSIFIDFIFFSGTTNYHLTRIITANTKLFSHSFWGLPTFVWVG
jgi:hypothetical protein